jgi:hypothetical protein
VIPIMNFIASSVAAANLTNAGTFTFNVEYAGTVLPKGNRSANSPMDCWQMCKDTEGDSY